MGKAEVDRFSPMIDRVVTSQIISQDCNVVLLSRLPFISCVSYDFFLLVSGDRQEKESSVQRGFAVAMRNEIGSESQSCAGWKPPRFLPNLTGDWSWPAAVIGVSAYGHIGFLSRVCLNAEISSRSTVDPLQSELISATWGSAYSPATPQMSFVWASECESAAEWKLDCFRSRSDAQVVFSQSHTWLHSYQFGLKFGVEIRPQTSIVLLSSVMCDSCVSESVAVRLRRKNHWLSGPVWSHHFSHVEILPVVPSSVYTRRIQLSLVCQMKVFLQSVRRNRMRVSVRQRSSSIKWSLSD